MNNGHSIGMDKNYQTKKNNEHKNNEYQMYVPG